MVVRIVQGEADIEDVFSPALYAQILNQAFGLTGPNEITAQKLIDADINTTRLVKMAEALYRQARRNSTTSRRWTGYSGTLSC